MKIIDLSEDQPAQREPVIDGVIRRGELGIMHGEAKCGTSHLLLDMVLSVAAGVPWMGFTTNSGRVLVVDNELLPSTICERIKNIVNAKQLHVDALGAIDVFSMRGEQKQLFQTLNDSIHGKQYALVVVDSLYRAMADTVIRPDSEANLSAFYHAASNIAVGGNFAIMFGAHRAKRADGAILIEGMVTQAMRLNDCYIGVVTSREDHRASMSCCSRSFRQMPSWSAKFEYPLWKRVESEAK